MKITIRLILFAWMILSISSCKNMYVPNGQNVSFMEEKGDIKANLGTKNIQVAYGITDHLGVMAKGIRSK